MVIICRGIISLQSIICRDFPAIMQQQSIDERCHAFVVSLSDTASTKLFVYYAYHHGHQFDNNKFKYLHWIDRLSRLDPNTYTASMSHVCWSRSF